MLAGRASPQAAARSEAKGPGEDWGEAFTLEASTQDLRSPKRRR